VYLQPYLR